MRKLEELELHELIIIQNDLLKTAETIEQGKKYIDPDVTMNREAENRKKFVRVLDIIEERYEEMF
jgi:ribosome-associated protein YbcJ (S4-like RNA binding protein)